ncbi:chymotrypsin-elastase inhibitor ixodidin [Cephus cinctus]|uniref:Chymotrypsin-elastase inhibitor ixodidin n=1 Tax=Cephus cinctus TaxID=211228 RepID=A0AAJ7FH94_CEPCN|nr:chymotrypsin-elastase inhibitor ixodidin [Cephus cinctus]
MRTVFIVISILVCLAVHSIQEEIPICRDNQVYKKCGTACPDACDVPERQNCLAVCVKGCFCKEGYILISRNSTYCIREKDCPKCPYPNTCKGHSH